MKKIESTETDVLIIGGGIAGIRAAIEAHDRGAGVILVNKGVFGRDGAATWMAGGGYCAALYPPDSIDAHVKDTITGGKYLNNQELVSTFLKLAPQGAKEITKWGARFIKDANHQFERLMVPGHSFARSLRAPMSAVCMGPEYSRALTSQTSRREITVVQDFFITDLLITNGRVLGAVGVDLLSGEFRVFKAKCTILATGGASCCYKLTTNGIATTGDGHAMAYRAGAKLMDMEFEQFLPSTALWPPSIRGSITPYIILVFLYGHYLNKQGERFMERYCPTKKDWATRDETCRAIVNEIKRGMGSPHVGVYLSVKHQPRNLIDPYLNANKDNSDIQKLREAGIDLHQDAIEVGIGAHYTLGGCLINEKCETSLAGLYAVGEVASGVDGADRLGGNAIPFCMAMGTVAGKDASLKASTIKEPDISQEQVEALMEEAFKPVNYQNGIKPLKTKERIQKIMDKYATFGRSKDGLETGLKRINEIREEDLPRLSVSAKNKKFNLEWLQALEVRNMVDVAEMVLRSAIMRTESRGTHDRIDYPELDAGWLKNIVIQQIEGQTIVSEKSVILIYVEP